MSMEKITKVWGTRDRVFESDKCEIDYLELYPNSQCSVHNHKNKINKFVVIEGEVIIKTGFGPVKLEKGDRVIVKPPLMHQFKTQDVPAKMIEIAYVNSGSIDSQDISREVQGGRTIDNVFYTLDEMREKNKTDMLKDYKQKQWQEDERKFPKPVQPSAQGNPTIVTAGEENASVKKMKSGEDIVYKKYITGYEWCYEYDKKGNMVYKKNCDGDEYKYDEKGNLIWD
jgi:mannose-6-phosphate isomerase-like protein (cupin superfamily)